MNFKNRIQHIEDLLNITGLDESELFREDFDYKGKPFNSIDEIHKGLNVTGDFTPFYTNEMYIRLFENKLLSFESKEMQGVRKKVVEEMRANI